MGRWAGGQVGGSAMQVWRWPVLPSRGARTPITQACLSDGRGCNTASGERCDTSGASPVCKPSCTGSGSLVCDASDSTCFCPSATPYCVAGQCKSQCSNGIKDAGEADVDCGGSGSCPRCSINSNCAGNSDCASGTCISSKCAVSIWG